MAPAAPQPLGYARRVSARGRVETVLHESELLAENPLGDPRTRELGIYLPPSYDSSSRRYPVILVLPGYAGTGLQLVARDQGCLP